MKKRISLLAAGDMSSKITIRGNDELADLSMSINKMIRDIKTLLNQKQQLLLDVSHELRSPLARIRLLTEMLPEHKNRKKLVDEVVFLEGMISNLLYSDKLSLPYTNVLYENIKTKILITKILDLIIVDLNRFDINYTAPNLEIWVDETKLIIALRNLIDNALKYGDPQQPVGIEVLQKKQLVFFKITNYGNKIESSDLNSIFKPFFRSQNNKLVSGSVKRVTRDNIIVDITHEAEALLPRDKLMPGEIYKINDRIRAVLQIIEVEGRGPQLMLNRSCPEMVTELFNIEVPEINEDVIEIRGIARDAGSRSKIAVKTNDGRIDPVGACVGMRGSRVQAVSCLLYTSDAADE